MFNNLTAFYYKLLEVTQHWNRLHKKNVVVYIVEKVQNVIRHSLSKLLWTEGCAKTPPELLSNLINSMVIWWTPLFKQVNRTEL